MKKILMIFVLLGSVLMIKSQPQLNLFDKHASLVFSAGTLLPGEEFSNNKENGLFAKDGFQLGFDVNYIIANGVGLGFNYEYNYFAFDKDAFLAISQPDRYLIRKGYRGNKIGMNLIFNLPIVIQPEKITVNLFVEGNAGFRTMSIPDIDLEYNELSNRYVEVTYRSRSNVIGYLGYSGGLQLLFGQQYGINVSYNALMKSRHSLHYSVRKFDAQERLEEEESFVNNFLDHSGLQIGFVMFLPNKATKFRK
jgi:hypothetical protein